MKQNRMSRAPLMTRLDDREGSACSTEGKDQSAERSGRVKGHIAQTDGGAVPMGYFGRAMGQAVPHAKMRVVGEGRPKGYKSP